jgi:hypothetical protein
VSRDFQQPRRTTRPGTKGLETLAPALTQATYATALADAKVWEGKYSRAQAQLDAIRIILGTL